MPLLEKQCSKCKQILPVEMFYKDRGIKDGLRSICKTCCIKYQQANPIAIQTSFMVSKARKRAKAKNIPFNIDLEYIRSIVVSQCPIFGVPLEWSARRGADTAPLPFSPSLDRIDPERGYVKGNVWIISHRANAIKNNATHEELKLVTNAVGKAIVDSLEF